MKRGGIDDSELPKVLHPAPAVRHRLSLLVFLISIFLFSRDFSFPAKISGPGKDPGKLGLCGHQNPPSIPHCRIAYE
jgi:hypothetical protein